MDGKNILLVEDEQIIAISTENALNKVGHKVCSICGTGEDAVAYIEANEKPDVILLDIRLAGEMSGIDAAKKINEMVDVPIIYLTSNSDALTINEAKTTYPVAFLTKPIDTAQLITTIEMSVNKFAKEQADKSKLLKKNKMSTMQINELTETNAHLITATWRERELKEELQKTKGVVEKQNRKILDSINYAF